MLDSFLNIVSLQSKHLNPMEIALQYGILGTSCIYEILFRRTGEIRGNLSTANCLPTALYRPNCNFLVAVWQNHIENKLVLWALCD